MNVNHDSDLYSEYKYNNDHCVLRGSVGALCCEKLIFYKVVFGDPPLVRSWILRSRRPHRVNPERNGCDSSDSGHNAIIKITCTFWSCPFFLFHRMDEADITIQMNRSSLPRKNESEGRWLQNTMSCIISSPFA